MPPKQFVLTFSKEDGDGIHTGFDLTKDEKSGHFLVVAVIDKYHFWEVHEGDRLLSVNDQSVDGYKTKVFIYNFVQDEIEEKPVVFVFERGETFFFFFFRFHTLTLPSNTDKFNHSSKM